VIPVVNFDNELYGWLRKIRDVDNVRR